MILREKYHISEKDYNDAQTYAEKSCIYTSNRHDFHSGSLKDKKEKMFEGKLGEKGFKMFLQDNNILFKEDDTPYYQRDKYDFLLKNNYISYTIDVKTRTKKYHTRTLEMVEQAKNYPKDIFVSAQLYLEERNIKLLGWYSYNDMIQKHNIENQGFLDNFVMYDSDLRPLSELYDNILINFINKS